MRKEKQYHFIYKTTNLLSGKYYIGMHSTNDLKDGYFGSGLYLKRSLNKYGKENHQLEILEFCKTREELKSRENEIVNLNEIAKKECMNLKVGGEGGWPMNSGDKFKHANEYWKIPENNKRLRNLTSSRNKKAWSLLTAEQRLCRLQTFNFNDKKHSDETKRKIGLKNSVKQNGTNNSQYGTCWITNEIENKKIYKGDEIPNGFKLGRI